MIQRIGCLFAAVPPLDDDYDDDDDLADSDGAGGLVRARSVVRRESRHSGRAALLATAGSSVDDTADAASDGSDARDDNDNVRERSGSSSSASESDSTSASGTLPLRVEVQVIEGLRAGRARVLKVSNCTAIVFFLFFFLFFVVVPLFLGVEIDFLFLFF